MIDDDWGDDDPCCDVCSDGFCCTHESWCWGAEFEPDDEDLEE